MKRHFSYAELASIEATQARQTERNQFRELYKLSKEEFEAMLAEKQAKIDAVKAEIAVVEHQIKYHKKCFVMAGSSDKAKAQRAYSANQEGHRSRIRIVEVPRKKLFLTYQIWSGLDKDYIDIPKDIYDNLKEQGYKARVIYK